MHWLLFSLPKLKSREYNNGVSGGELKRKGILLSFGAIHVIPILQMGSRVSEDEDQNDEIKKRKLDKILRGDHLEFSVT